MESADGPYGKHTMIRRLPILEEGFSSGRRSLSYRAAGAGAIARSGYILLPSFWSPSAARCFLIQ